MKKLVVLLFMTICVVIVCGNDTGGAPTTSASTTTQKPTLSPEEDCALGNKSCKDCVARGAKCLFCQKPQKCVPYPVGQVIPHGDVCPLKQARWGVCWVNYEVLLIVMGCFAGVLLITFGCCIYCCCCRNDSARQRKKYQKEEARVDQEREERSAKHSERRAERQSRMDEIRQKYGLVKDDKRYKKFEDEA